MKKVNGIGLIYEFKLMEKNSQFSTEYTVSFYTVHLSNTVDCCTMHYYTHTHNIVHGYAIALFYDLLLSFDAAGAVAAVSSCYLFFVNKYLIFTFDCH